MKKLIIFVSIFFAFLFYFVTYIPEHLTKKGGVEKREKGNNR